VNFKFGELKKRVEAKNNGELEIHTDTLWNCLVDKLDSEATPSNTHLFPSSASMRAGPNLLCLEMAPPEASKTLEGLSSRLLPRPPILKLDTQINLCPLVSPGLGDDLLLVERFNYERGVQNVKEFEPQLGQLVTKLVDSLFTDKHWRLVRTAKQKALSRRKYTTILDVVKPFLPHILRYFRAFMFS
jgi:hypothetical protein